ncbi:hypothetical protein METBIDRAFT_81264 [Metschnikowia bicuspidata var. bicuspidata NRRL YB-4993]|uniref:Dihydrolipoamide acetyltransferase component of pyruvate dehydrogenase complex n=1 Tax=Metschnikowia bicuspidata var. bicuspidata NRRL YB-4993 TaxID=869754 RepID=A0A1A0HIP3_9ASCO|nr:hypothetical protein METBIDRAFT_81264 [Metschnikowia bicuspidata var. bicuspidata NRRL YB-4993]OBA23880.1 hypothetical protein METBIDRAFT_81264 [Metschnikowia bicuspidata var. bicuspidata NRRL YB-4993]
MYADADIDKATFNITIHLYEAQSRFPPRPRLSAAIAKHSTGPELQSFQSLPNPTLPNPHTSKIPALPKFPLSPNPPHPKTAHLPRLALPRATTQAREPRPQAPGRAGEVAPARHCESGPVRLRPAHCNNPPAVCPERPARLPTPPHTTMLRRFASPARAARAFSCRAAALNALVFRMPAMSPTMTEGGIVAWKYKPGASFASGDVLLEVETDKATIDVEATDDGVLWELLHHDGESGIPVGQPIALLAEPGDDLATLARPALELPAAAETKAAETKAPQTKAPQTKAPQTKAPQTKAPQTKAPEARAVAQRAEPTANGANPQTAAPTTPHPASRANAALKVSPAVEVLLHRHGLSRAHALAHIPASGPQGRLLKGDVLAHLGLIDAAAVARAAAYARSRQHLDLSHISVAPAAPRRAAPAPPARSVTIQYSADLGHAAPRAQLHAAFEAAVRTATRHAHAARFPAYAHTPLAAAAPADDLFGDLLVAPVSTARFHVHAVRYSGAAAPAPAPEDLFAELVGQPRGASAAAAASVPGLATAHFQVTYDTRLSDARAFVAAFEESLRRQGPAQQLTVHA